MNYIEALMTIPQIAKLLPTDAAMHACAVAGKFDGDDRICLVALLHDVVEDKYATFEELKERFNLDKEQMQALEAITRRDGEKYFDYIARVQLNDMATKIKLVDLQLNIIRCAESLPNRWSLFERYYKAYKILIGDYK